MGDKEKKWDPIRVANPGDEDKLKEKCKDPAFVAMCLEQFQLWRRGKGEYSFSEDPENDSPMPLCPRSLSIVEDAAIEMLGRVQ